MERRIKGRKVWIFILLGVLVLVLVLLSGCNGLGLVTDPEIVRLEIQNEKFRSEISELREQIADLQVQTQLLEGRLKVTGGLEEGETIIGKVFYIKSVWKIILVSYQLFGDRSIKFNFVIENLKDDPYLFGFKYRDLDETYIVDDLGNQYGVTKDVSPKVVYPPAIIGGRFKFKKTFPPKMPLKGNYLTFPPLERGVETINLVFSYALSQEGRWDEDDRGTITVRNIKLHTK